ncbi:hypothetical protein PHYBLDRAFT_119888, partial [Phycomyces blakesleeanus NRRL 1555(-)]
DESMFMVKGNDSDASVICKTRERFQQRHIFPTVKFGKGSVTVCGCFWTGGSRPLVALEGSVNKDVYVDCLSNDFDPWYQKLNEEHDTFFTFQEDGASCHTGSYTTWWKSHWQIKQFDY